MRFMPLIFLVGILINASCVLVFRLKLDRRYSERFYEYQGALNTQLADFTTNALASIDRHFASNAVSRLRFDTLSDSSQGDSFRDSSFSLYRVVGDWDYSYFQISNIDYARVGFRNYRVGDKFPRGGVITAIHADGVEIDGRYWVRNVVRSEGRYRASSLNSEFSDIATSRNVRQLKLRNQETEVEHEFRVDNGPQ